MAIVRRVELRNKEFFLDSADFESLAENREW